MNIYNVLVITPIDHIDGVLERLSSNLDVDVNEECDQENLKKIIHKYDSIFTNPNKSTIYIGKEIIDAGIKGRLKVICTASTGTVHIDKAYAVENGVEVISLTDERDVINRISSTAELAFAITLSSLRNIIPASNSVKLGQWDYLPFVGRQFDSLTIGVIGYGRLGSLYAKYWKAFNSRIIVYDPYKKVDEDGIEQLNDLMELIRLSDVISLHIHVTPETRNMINVNCFELMKNNVLIVNTSRGEIINEKDCVNFLKSNPTAKLATDVLSNEVNRKESVLLNYLNDQTLITPHIGGMTKEAQIIAYNHAASLLISRLLK